MLIEIRDLTFNTIIGILDFERLTPQKVIVHCTIEYTFTQDNFINYAEVAAHIKEQMQQEQFLLIEDALLSLKSSLQAKFSTIEQLTLKIAKPDILDNCVVSLQESFTF